MTRLLLKLTPDSARTDLTYFMGKLNVILSLSKALDISNECSFSLYNDQFWMLLYAATGDKEVKRKEHDFNVSFSQSVLWIPGDYIFLFHSGEIILRFDLQLDEHGVVTEKGFRQCAKMSDEDILSGALPSINAWRTFFSNTPGMMQWKRWLIERLQERAFNTLRAEHRHGVLAYCNNLLVASPSPDFASRNITLLKFLADIKCETHCADCTTLYDPSSCNPYHNLEELFSSQVSDDNMLGLSLPVSKDRIYCFRNIWALLEPGREYVLKKILSHCPGFALIRLDGEAWDTHEGVVSKTLINKSPDFEGWDFWKEQNKKGFDVEVKFMRNKNKITVITENFGISINSVVTVIDEAPDIYASITGDQIVVTNVQKIS